MISVSRLLIALLVILLTSCATRGERRSALIPNHSIELARQFDFVDVRAFIPGIAIDLRYATPHNVARRPIFPPRMPCLLGIETAQEALHRHGGNTGIFFSQKAGWSRHCGGVAVDLTLVDAQGREQRMPTYFDQDFKNAGHHYRGGDPVIKQNLERLKDAMKQSGFTQLESEWWHFDDEDYIFDPQPIVFGRELSIPVL
jgi:D-alanyl-D-alanine dipeptidase